jgi:hypothetical protein
MRKVNVSKAVWLRLDELTDYMIDNLKLSEEAAMRRIDRFNSFISALGNPVNHPLCRFKRWQTLGYRCAVFERSWIFAYEVFDDGIIVRDMAHTATLAK